MDRASDRSVLRYLVPVERLSHKGLDVTIDADERERTALAEAHGLEKVSDFRAELHLAPWKKRGVRVRGRVRAAVTQTCIVTLEPIESVIEEEVDALFVPERSRLARIDTDDAGELVLDAEGPDMPETFDGDTLDTGAIAEEFFELAIDPYPRKEGATLNLRPGTDEAGSTVSPSPFAGLAAWKAKQ